MGRMGKKERQSYSQWRAEVYNSNFRCLALGFGRVTEQTAVQQSHVTATSDCKRTRSNPCLPCGAACCPTFFTSTFQAIQETGGSGGCEGVSLFPVFHSCATYWCEWTDAELDLALPLNQPASASSCPFALLALKSLWMPGILVSRLFKPWQANLPKKVL